MITAVDFNLVHNLILRAAKLGMAVDAEVSSPDFHKMRLLKFEEPYMRVIYQSQTVEDLWAFLDGYQAKQLHAAMPEEQSSGG